jgi:hypothetical protein
MSLSSNTNSTRKQLFFILLALALMAPYLAFMVYFSLRYPSGLWPRWLVNTLAAWFVTNFLIICLLARRIFRGSVADPEKARIIRRKSARSSTRLVILWSLLFLYGLKETIDGKIPLNRAIQAGALLLFFIGIFGWHIYRSRQAPS